MAHFNQGMNRRWRWIHKYFFHMDFHNFFFHNFLFPEAKMVLTIEVIIAHHYNLELALVDSKFKQENNSLILVEHWSK